MKNIREQVTTVEQSKKLVELGFTKDSASLKWECLNSVDNSEHWAICFAGGIQPDELRPTLPCWTIADMMKILNDTRGFDLDVLGQIGIYSVDEPCKLVVGKEIIARDDYSILRDNFFEALVELKKNKCL